MTDRTVAAVVLLAAALISAPGSLQSTSSTSQNPNSLPFDPLTEGEEQSAVDIAASNASVEGKLGVRTETIGAAVRTAKVAGALSEMTRMADVWFYNYVTDEAVWVVVDLDERRVRELVDAPDYDPPLTEGEIRGAGELASQHPNVTQRLAGAEVQAWLGYRWSGGSEDACQVNRCLLVAPVVDGSIADFLALVNLSQGVVDGVFDRASVAEEGVR